MAYDFKRAFRLDRASRADTHASVQDELEHHIELGVEELVSSGWSEADARRETLRQFGDLQQTQAYCEEMQTRRGREVGRMLSLDEMWQDLKYAVRALRKSPGYAALVVATLAFGIAANTTIFSVMNPYLFRPLPFGEPEGLVQVNQVEITTEWEMGRFSYAQYEDWQSRSRAFSKLAAYSYGSANVTDQEGPEQIQFSELTANMFDVLDSQARIGRTFRPEEGVPGGARVVLMADGLWQRRYAADPSIVGRTITMDGVQRTVIGIMPPEFNFPFGGVKLWVPIQETASTTNRASNPYQLIGRLNEGWTADRAKEELTGIQASLAVEYPDTDGRMSGVSVLSLREALNFAWDILNVLFLILLGAVGFVLLIACVNVASLTLARGSGRRREVSVRAALGARRGRIIRQLLTESLVLSLLGGALGIGMSYWITSLLNPLIPEDLFKIGAISIDRAVLAFSLLVTLTTPIAFGLLPALSASKVDLTLGLKEGSKSSGGLGASRGRRVLVITQVALAVILITGAGLMLRSFASVQQLDLGFDPELVLTTEIILGADEYRSADERRAFMTEAVSAVSGVAGVSSASAVRWLPLNHETIMGVVTSTDMAGAPVEDRTLSLFNDVLPDYFETMGIELVAGRGFGSMDGTDAQRVILVNRILANRFWPDGGAVGQALLVGEPGEEIEMSVIGIVDEVHHADLDPAQIGPQLYRSALQTNSRRFFVLGRTTSDLSTMVSGVRRAIQSIAPSLPVVIRPMNDVVSENQVQWSVASIFLGLFGGGALLLATLGIYGLISYSVAQRQRELGVRIAMGASSSEIRRGVVVDGLSLTGIGLAIGLAASLAVGQLISSLLFDVSPFDPLTLGTVLVLFLGVAALASFLPAARASNTDPISVLRSE
jgi:predicted permease